MTKRQREAHRERWDRETEKNTYTEREIKNMPCVHEDRKEFVNLEDKV